MGRRKKKSNTFVEKAKLMACRMGLVDEAIELAGTILYSKVSSKLHVSKYMHLTEQELRQEKEAVLFLLMEGIAHTGQANAENKQVLMEGVAQLMAVCMVCESLDCFDSERLRDRVETFEQRTGVKG